MKILILSNWTQGPGTKRLLGAAIERGHEAYAINYRRCYCNIERNNPQIHYDKGEIFKGVDAIIPRIAISTQEYGSAIIRQFEMMNVFSTTGSLAFLRARDKLRSMQLLARHNISIPRTVFARETKDIDKLIDLVGSVPLIIKVAKGSLGVGVMLAETRSAARSIIQAFYSENVDILVQEYIKESQGIDVRAFIIDGKVVGAMQRQAPPGEFRSNINQGGSGTITRLTKEERQIAVKAAKAMNLAIAGVDILRSDEGPLVMEVNAFPGLEGIEKATGKDIAGNIIAYVEKNVPKKRTRDRVGA